MHYIFCFYFLNLATINFFTYFSDIFYNSEQGSQLKFAFQENVVAHALRDAGYDSVVGFNRRKLTEIFDVREGNYPSETSDTPWATYAPESQTLYQTAYHGSPHDNKASTLHQKKLRSTRWHTSRFFLKSLRGMQSARCGNR